MTKLIEAYLKSELKTLTGYEAYPLIKPSKVTLPCMTYKKISGIEHRSHSGTDARQSRYQIDCWGDTYAKAKNLAETLIAGLDGNKTNWKLSTVENELEVMEEEENLYRVIIEIYLWS